MPIRIPDALPATEVLESENIFVMTEHRAIHQDIRPLRVLILNLMPLKIETETQIASSRIRPCRLRSTFCKPSRIKQRTYPPSTWNRSTWIWMTFATSATTA